MVVGLQKQLLKASDSDHTGYLLLHFTDEKRFITLIVFK